MIAYSSFVAALGSPWGSDAFNAAFPAELLGRKLKKGGAYRAEIMDSKHGFSCIFGWRRPDWFLSSVHFYAKGVDGCRQYMHALAGVSLPATRHDVRATLGAPSRTGGDGSLIDGWLKNYHWDRFDSPEHSLRFEYESTDGAVRLVTLMSAEKVRELGG